MVIDRRVLLCAVIACLVLFAGCKPKQNATSSPGNAPQTNTPAQKQAGPLPDSGFKAQITATDPPQRLRTGQVAIINIKVKNTSDVIWYPRGGPTTDRPDATFYIAAGNRWLDKDGKLSSETEGHNAIVKELKPGEDTEMTLQITAPKQPGDWTMQLDLVQEGVAWFSEKGSPVTNIKVQVVK